MSDKDLRNILSEVMEELDSGRLVLQSRGRTLRRMVAPALLAASLGLGACDAEPVGTEHDAEPDVWISVDAMYGVPDVAPLPDAGLDAAPADDGDVVDDAQVDSGPIGVYLAPPPCDPDER